MVLAGKVARRYARALVMLAEEHHKHEALANDLGRVTSELKRHPALRRQLLDPALDLGVRRERLLVAVKPLAIDRLTQNFLCLLLDNHRFAEIDAIAAEFQRQLDVLAGRVRAQVTTAVQLQPLARNRLQMALKRLTGKQVVLETVVDPAILGGVVTQVGHVLIDGSLRAQLERLKTELTQRN